MKLDIYRKRFDHLNENIDLGLNLLSDVEEELLFETDPIRKSKYMRDKERLLAQLIGFRTEVDLLRANIGQSPGESADLIVVLEGMNQKIESILTHQQSTLQGLELLRRDILDKLETHAQDLLRPILGKLNAADLDATKRVLGHIENVDIESQQVRQILGSVRAAADEVIEMHSNDPEVQRILTVADTFDDPKLEIKHRLKLTIPIIPFLLSYESEAGWNNSANLRRTWEWLLQKTGRNKTGE